MAYFLDRAKGKLLGHKRRELVRGTYKLERVEARTGQDLKESQLVRGTHNLEKAEVETSQVIGRKQASEVHSLAREGRGQD